MQYVRSISGSVSATWKSINPATLSGAIDVIVVEHEDGSLACSPFHVRFGKVSILRPSDKKVQFKVNGVVQNYPMKLGEGGEAFFVFETLESIPAALQTSPVASPATSPRAEPITPPADSGLSEPEPLHLEPSSQADEQKGNPPDAVSGPALLGRTKSDAGDHTPRLVPTADLDERPKSGDWSGHGFVPPSLERAASEAIVPTVKADLSKALMPTEQGSTEPPTEAPNAERQDSGRSNSPPPVSPNEALHRAMTLSKKLWGSNIASQVTDSGNLMLDTTGYKSTEEEQLRAEGVARKILSEELEGNYDIGALIGADEKGNVWIYSSEEAKQAADRKAGLQNLNVTAMRSSDAISDPGYHTDEAQSETGEPDYLTTIHERHDSDSAVSLQTPPPASPESGIAGETVKSYAKTLRLTTDQLKAMNLKPGANSMSFTVNRATNHAFIYYWRHDVPIVISDIDGTITKSDIWGHVYNTIGRDWTHLGVAKLYTDISTNGYNIFYLTSRSVGQADSTRTYLNGIVQDGYKLPKGPVIMSPDRTATALKREIWLRQPEVFKMACLRDIMTLFNKPPGQTPFYAGFGNRLSDALSYRSVNIPATRIFTINANSEISLDLLSLNKYKTAYTSMREIVDHYFPPVTLLVKDGGEQFTDFNYWRDRPRDLDDFSLSGSETSDGEEDEDEESIHSEDDAGAIGDEDLEASYMSRESVDSRVGMEDSILESAEGDPDEESELPEDMETSQVIEVDADVADELERLGLASQATTPGEPSKSEAPDSLKDLSKPKLNHRLSKLTDEEREALTQEA